MFQKFFIFAVIIAMMAIVFTNSMPAAEEGEAVDQTFCKLFSTCVNSTDCASNLIYKTCRTNLVGSLQCCL
ncbi:hypothetical protein DAPPUDRAFT_306406 [Daphnia pulex]|uniref:Uncharacterized protein n=1 Tax=Daphnia pulex TaxID=6669 RepID=E9FYL4_DAPPU|nr:hypothetical protein DAPPUDRAFT_306406 [Daphnia pulex]|eukprot:EFX87549.1 hypothetical protein DAPPUDRAFT_306406 [Daphnia pulex]